MSFLFFKTGILILPFVKILTKVGGKCRIMIKQYNNKKNIAGSLIKEARERNKMPKTELSRRLGLKRNQYQQR